MQPEKIQIESTWKEALWDEFQKPYWESLSRALHEVKAQDRIIYPPGDLIFNAFNLTPLDRVRVVILGQDPYHGPGEAMGLCFSVPKNIRIPPSLVNIFKELRDDVGCTIPSHGDLTSWANQGVFLLNAMLTVEHRTPGAHKNIGWQTFTDAVIRILSERKENLVFLLWGRFAQSKQPLIDEFRHYVLTAAHPSPLARNAFMGCKHFSRTNEILLKRGLKPINWQIN